MRSLINFMLIFFLTISTHVLVHGFTEQQNEDQHSSPQEQQAPTFQQQNEAPPSKSTAVRVYDGCVVQTDHGYSLKTKEHTYPIETAKGLSHYVNKQVSVTAILEHHQTPDITDLRVRLISKVIGDCNQAQ